MRILKVVQSYYPFQEKGGTAVKVRALARGLAHRGHQVTVLTSDLGLRNRTGHGMQLERCEWGWRAKQDEVEAIYLPSLGRYRALTLNPRVIGFCRAMLGDFDLTHFYGLYDLLGPSVARRCRQRHIPYMIEPMGMYRPIDRSFRLKAWWHRSVGREFWRGAARIIATSEMEQQELIEDGVSASKITVRYNGIDPSLYASRPVKGTFRAKWRIPQEEILVVFLSRLIPRKGADILIEAFAQACPQSGRLVIAGPEGENGYRLLLEQRAQEYGVSHRVIFTGPLYDAEKNALLADGDLFVLPSRYENFANAAAEAMAFGVPVIVTNSCGIRSLVSDRAGLVIDSDPKLLAEAIRNLIGDTRLYGQFKAGCRRVAEQLSWNHLTEQMEGHYFSAMATSNGVH
ncbi:MAG TPA: glycosyltransferase [Candidatus Acidoferrales bacterium]|nr:glycosyltransferase [Candidatus Acidoferrales bacterium]